MLDPGKYHYSSGKVGATTWLALLSAVLIITACGSDSQTTTDNRAGEFAAIPIAPGDDVVSNLAPYLIADPETYIDEEINTLIDLCIEESWAFKFHEPGIFYHMINPGDDPESHPEWGDYVAVHYQGKLLDGRIFDSSRKREKPFTFYVGNVIKGWNVALEELIPVGGRALLLIPSGLAYGHEGFGKLVPPDRHLLFDIELLEILALPEQ